MPFTMPVPIWKPIIPGLWMPLLLLRPAWYQKTWMHSLFFYALTTPWLQNMVRNLRMSQSSLTTLRIMAPTIWTGIVLWAWCSVSLYAIKAEAIILLSLSAAFRLKMPYTFFNWAVNALWSLERMYRIDFRIRCTIQRYTTPSLKMDFAPSSKPDTSSILIKSISSTLRALISSNICIQWCFPSVSPIHNPRISLIPFTSYPSIT